MCRGLRICKYNVAMMLFNPGEHEEIAAHFYVFQCYYLDKYRYMYTIVGRSIIMNKKLIGS